jgi:hypothetical protein
MQAWYTIRNSLSVLRCVWHQVMLLVPSYDYCCHGLHSKYVCMHTQCVGHQHRSTAACLQQLWRGDAQEGARLFRFLIH